MTRPVSPRHRLRDLAADPRWVLLPLRGYLAFTFLWAGLSKLGGQSFLDPSAPTSMYSTLVAVRAASPIGGLLGPVEAHPWAFGVVLAIAETAVGIGMVLGLFTRVAAVGGILISLSLFLTVSWNADPWYTGADIVYLFAFTPMLLAGAGPLSLDARLVRRGRGADARDVPATSRRAVLGGLAAAGGALAVGAASGIRAANSPSTPVAARSTATGEVPSSSSSAPTSASAAPAAKGADAIVAAADVPVGSAVQEKDPTTGDDMFVLQLEAGTFTGLDARCPHQGCTVQFESKSEGFVCPCHQSRFSSSGALLQGPATTGLTAIPVRRSGSEIVRG